MLKRRTDERLFGVFVLLLAASLIGGAWVALWEPCAVGLAAALGVPVGLTLARSLDAGWKFGAGLGIVLGVFGIGAYAVHAAGAPIAVAIGVAAAEVALVVVMLGRALVASGAADDPYDA